jgi:hypothetical protein
MRRRTAMALKRVHRDVQRASATFARHRPYLYRSLNEGVHTETALQTGPNPAQSCPILGQQRRPRPADKHTRSALYVVPLPAAEMNAQPYAPSTYECVARIPGQENLGQLQSSWAAVRALVVPKLRQHLAPTALQRATTVPPGFPKACPPSRAIINNTLKRKRSATIHCDVLAERLFKSSVAEKSCTATLLPAAPRVWTPSWDYQIDVPHMREISCRPYGI